MAKIGRGRASRPEFEIIESITAGLTELRGLLPQLPTRAANGLAAALAPLAFDIIALREAAKPAKKPEMEALDGILEKLLTVRRRMPDLTRPAGKELAARMEQLLAEIEAVRLELDPIKMPAGFFDPTDPDTAGRLVVLALIAQPRVPLSAIARTYGSGVYAIYYHGAHPAYKVISGSETPIYVGKADPSQSSAKTPREQGDRLFGRLKDHRKMIRDVGRYAVEQGLANALSIDDFSCRKLVCATNAQLVAERHLIGIFSPIWNQETNICWGISKHGDDADMRGNDRSPWDVVHPGRKWALSPKLVNAMSISEIFDGLGKHFATNPPYNNREHLVEKIIAAFSQQVATTDPALQEAEDSIDDVSADFGREGPPDSAA